MLSILSRRASMEISEFWTTSLTGFAGPVCEGKDADMLCMLHTAFDNSSWSLLVWPVIDLPFLICQPRIHITCWHDRHLQCLFGSFGLSLSTKQNPYTEHELKALHARQPLLHVLDQHDQPNNIPSTHPEPLRKLHHTELQTSFLHQNLNQLSTVPMLTPCPTSPQLTRP